VQLDEPVRELSFLSINLMSALAREHGIKVLLTGDGSDEIFGGYPWHPGLRRLGRIERVPGLGPMLSLAARFPMKPVNAAKLKDLRLQYRKSDVNKFVGYHQMFTPDVRAAAFQRPLEADPIWPIVEPIFEQGRGADLASRFALTELELWVGNHFNQRVDRMTMAASVEGRVPFQDNEVIELALSIPFSERLRGGVAKAPLRAAFADALPRAVVDRPKLPFSTPADHWLRGPLLISALRSQTLQTWQSLPGLDPAVGVSIHAALGAELTRPEGVRSQAALALGNVVMWAEEFSRSCRPLATV
jgi:asparagine synthase (glutamine-hydrolysing)